MSKRNNVRGIDSNKPEGVSQAEMLSLLSELTILLNADRIEEALEGSKKPLKPIFREGEKEKKKQKGPRPRTNRSKAPVKDDDLDVFWVIIRLVGIYLSVDVGIRLVVLAQSVPFFQMQ